MARHTIGGARRHVILSKPQESRLLKLAEKTQITPSEHIRRAIDSYFRLLDIAEQRARK
jgi:hypothetical protein